MRQTIHRTALLTLLVMLTFPMVGCEPAPSPPAVSTTPDETANPARELQWDELMPADYEPEALFEGVDIASLVDDDPQAIALMEKLRKLWDYPDSRPGPRRRWRGEVWCSFSRFGRSAVRLNASADSRLDSTGRPARSA